MGVTVAGLGFDIGTSAPSPRYWPDPWLETRSSEGEPVLPTFFSADEKGDWVRIRHSVLAAARTIESEANLIAPDFVKSQGTIGIEVLPVSVWGPGEHRIRATFTEFGAEQRDLRVVGAGTARWAAAAIRLACRRLESGRQVVADTSGRLIDDDDERRPIIREAYSEALAQMLVRLEPSSAPAVYIADEPESHLHPAALQSVRKWLTKLAETAAMVLVATHSPALLDSPSELIHRVLVLRDGDATKLRPMTGALGVELARVSETLGLTKGELLLMTRLALFVEGPHDQIILDEWFGQQLRAAGVRIFPVHGARHLPGLAESEIIAALGIRIAAVTDETSIARVTSRTPRTTGEVAVTRLIAEAKRAGFKVHAVGFSEPDILYYLDETICQKVAPAFPGWREAVNGWASTGKRGSWKHWVESKYRLSLTRDNIRDLAQECCKKQKIPAELSRVISGLIAYTSNTT
jgi:energy-coupling factor transporter ATP-binding protein EcfA2